MNTNFLEKILGNWFFIIFNIIIIAIVEGMGTYFYDTGMLHVIAIFFIALAVIRIFIHYRTYDQFLDKIKNASIVALFIFAASHIMEYINFTVYYRYDDAVFITTIQFYLIGLASIDIGAELFLAKYDHRSYIQVILLYLLSITLAISNIAISLNHNLITLKMNSVFPYLYTALAIILLTIGIRKIHRLKKKISISVGFLNYMMRSISLIAITTIPNIYYEVLEEAFDIPMFQTMYISHFIFFMSLSLMFLSYKQLANLTGLYAEAAKIK